MSSVPVSYAQDGPSAHGLRKFLYENGLSLAMVAAFAVFLIGQSITGFRVFNQEQRELGLAPIGFAQYLHSGHFFEATFENWESEWLQMAAFIWCAVHLRQKGSPESKSIGEAEDVDREPDPNQPHAPWPVRKGGLILKLYSRSLTLAFLLLFFVSFLLHAAGGAREYTRQQLAHGQPGASMLQFMGTSEFWFQSMQNWQSEFLSIGAMVYLAVYLRQKGSPESKPVDSPHDENE